MRSTIFVAATLLVSLSNASPLALVERASDLMSSAVTVKLPPARGWSDASDSAQPCGGIAFNGTRTLYPVSGGNISILAYADANNLQINYASVEDPNANSQFSMAIHENSATTYRGHHCLDAPDFGALGFAAGQKLTLQTRWRAGTAATTLYQCSDIELVDPATYVPPAGRDGMCFSGALDVATVNTNDYSDNLGGGGLSGGAKAGIAVGSIAGAALLAAAAYFGYKKQRANKSNTVKSPVYTEDSRTLSGSPVPTYAPMQEKKA